MYILAWEVSTSSTNSTQGCFVSSDCIVCYITQIHILNGYGITKSKLVPRLARKCLLYYQINKRLHKMSTH